MKKPIDRMLRLADLPQKEGLVLNYAGLRMEFDHLDGAYSYCVVLEGKSKGQVFHVSSGSILKRVANEEYEVLEN